MHKVETVDGVLDEAHINGATGGIVDLYGTGQMPAASPIVFVSVKGNDGGQGVVLLDHDGIRELVYALQHALKPYGEDL